MDFLQLLMHKLDKINDEVYIGIYVCVCIYIYVCMCVCVCVCTYVYMEKEMATHSSVLAWRIPWMEDPGGLQSMGSQRVKDSN